MSTSVELSIYQALKSAGVDDERATAAAESVVDAIDKRYAIHSRQLATSGDVEKVWAELERVRIEVAKSETNVMKAIADTQRWTLAAIFAGMAAVAAIIKLL